MPGIFYTSPEFLELERAHLFQREWVCLGRVEELENPGDYLTGMVLEEPIVLIRGDDGLIHAFSNICRHRGMVIAEGSGSCRRLVCPYHHWTYDRLGRLVGAPNLEGRPGFDKKNYRLPEIKCEIWQGFVFVSLTENPQPLSLLLAPLEERIGHYGFGEMKLRYISNEVWDTNWKCLMENFMEGYHLSSLHRKTLHRLNPTSLCQHFEPGDAYFGFYSGFSMNLDRVESKNPDLEEEDVEQCVMFAVPPGLAVGGASDYSSFISIQPLSVGQVRVKLGLFFSNDDWPDTKVEEAIELFQRTAKEDKIALKGVQVGLASKYHEQGPLAYRDYEGCILDFYNYLARRLAHEL
ncbi:MAG: aromatic ring-hydroxylating dioxygenase subunit alpha [Kiloniellales bacterium]|nr:aromatic ring-hydroxylating dioxygenase subunit alpha [Kiloniellales bacterium]